MKSFLSFLLRKPAFIYIGPFIGTFCVAITFHISAIQRDYLHFLQGLITLSIVLPMIAALIFITPFGYLFGFIPATITNLLFERLFKTKMASATVFKAFVYGCVLSSIWIPLTSILAMLTLQPLSFFLYTQFVLIFPSTIICTLLEWKKLKLK